MNKPMMTLLIAVLMGVTFSATAHAQNQVLRFSGWSYVVDIEEALAMAGIDLVADTPLTASEADDLKAATNWCHVIPMTNPASGLTVGTGIDCLGPMPAHDGSNGLEVTALSLFIRADGNGSLVTTGLTSVQPFIHHIGDADGAVTHMTGSIPAGPGGVLGGTGMFRNASGSARVSGAVDLSQAGSDTVLFDCLWLIEFDPYSRGVGR